MSAPQRPLNGEQILQRIGAEATGRDLITAADAEAARAAIEAQQQNDGLDFIASSNPTDPGLPPTGLPGSTYVLGTNGWQITMREQDIQDKYLDDNSIWLGDDGVAEPFATGAKGRDLLAIADDAALQSEIVARIAGATIAPAQVNVTGKISTTSTDADSIETAGGIVAADAVAASASVIFAAGNTSTHGTFLTARGSQEWYLRDGNDDFAGSIRYVTPSNLPGIAFYNSTGDDRSDIMGAREGAGFLFRLDGLNTMELFRVTPAAATAGRTNIGNGTIDTASRVIARSTAADAIQSQGGGVFAGPVAGSAMRGQSTGISDDAAVSFLTPSNHCMARVFRATSNSFQRVSELFWLRSTSSPTAQKMAGITGGQDVDYTTGALTGTTGVDGNVTISATDDGRLYIENRSGSFGTFFIQFFD